MLTLDLCGGNTMKIKIPSEERFQLKQICIGECFLDGNNKLFLKTDVEDSMGIITIVSLTDGHCIGLNGKALVRKLDCVVVPTEYLAALEE